MSLKHVPPSLCHHRTLSLTSASALTCIDHMTQVFQALQNPFYVNNNHSAIKVETGKLERNPKHIHQKLICYSKPILTTKVLLYNMKPQAYASQSDHFTPCPSLFSMGSCTTWTMAAGQMLLIMDISVIQYMETQGLLHPWGKELATDLLEGVWFSKPLVGLKGECNTPSLSLGHETPNPSLLQWQKFACHTFSPTPNWTASQFYAVCSGHWYNNANTEFSAMKDSHQPKYFKTTSKEKLGIMSCPLP